jgi:two-component system sensor histidine kinase KdpD
MRRLVYRLAISVALMGVLLAVCSRLPQMDHATVALLMVLAIAGLARMWGWAEALAGAIVGGLGYDYYFLAHDGLGIAAPEHWVALLVFLMTAIVIGQLAAQLTRQRIEAEEQHHEIEKLYRLASAMLGGGGLEFSLEQLAGELVVILGAKGVALYDLHSGRTVRSGPRASAISDQALHETGTGGSQLGDGRSTFSLVPIRHAGKLAGSIGIYGSGSSESLLGIVAGRVGVGLARLDAIKKATEAEAVRRAEELKSALLDAVAHEVRNPLNTIKVAATTLLSEHSGSEADQRELLTIIAGEVIRMDHFLDDAVQMARVEAAKISLKKEPQNLARLIPAAIEELGPLTVRRPIEVKVPESLPAAECDGDMIRRVLKQLVSNALKYSPDNSLLTVSAEFTGEAIRILVMDRGPGVDDEERDRIFEKHYRGHANRLSTSGTGLGLASCRSIVRAHGGEIWMTRPPDGGSAFHVSLPVAAGGAEASR